MTAAEDVKTCCASAYSSDLVAMLLGEAYHPGGLDLTRRLADQLALRPGQAVLDVASGPGTTAKLLAAEYGARVTGVDLSPANVAAATEAAGQADLSYRVGDAEALPVPDASFEAVVCECAFCTFPNKPTAAAEFARVLRPGGRVGITDVTAQPNRLPPALSGLAARVACIADARPVDAYADLLAGAGLRVRPIPERHHDALLRMIDQIEARLKLVTITAPQRAAALGLDLDRAGEVITAARTAVADGILGYTLLVADKPA